MISCLDKHAWIRKNAITALKKIGTPAVEPLIAALKSKDKEIKGYAASILGGIKDNRAIEPLIDLLDDKDSTVRKMASKALKTITGTHMGEDQKQWQEWWKDNKEKFPLPENLKTPGNY